MIVAVGAIVFLLALVVAGFVMVRIGKSLSSRERVVFVAVIVVAVAYFLPRMIHASIVSYRKGVEIRQGQGR